jgi:hypothetical protein
MKMRGLLTLWAAVVVAVAVVVAGPLPGEVAGAQTAPVVTLPIVVCPTTIGVTSSPKHLPSSETFAVPAGLAGQLSAYTDNQGELAVVAPRGWACKALVGADGSASVSVHPGGQAGSLYTSWPRGAQAVTAVLVPACVGCELETACAFFPSAEHQLVTTYGGDLKCHRRPSAEGVARLSPTAVEFSDPAGVHGTGNPSGGNYPATGVVTYKPSTSKATYGTWTETCTLSPRSHAVCAATIQAFVARWDESVASQAAA